MEKNANGIENNNSHNASSIIGSEASLFFNTWTREQVVSYVSFAYVIISILMVLLWSMYLCIDGRRNPKKDTRVIHMLAQNAFFRSVP